MSSEPRQREVYFNGRYVPESQASVSIYDSALMFGDMAFEFTRTFKHKPFRLREHLDRLYASMKILRIDPGMSLDEMEKVTLEVLEHNAPLVQPEIDFQMETFIWKRTQCTFTRRFLTKIFIFNGRKNVFVFVHKSVLLNFIKNYKIEYVLCS